MSNTVAVWFELPATDLGRAQSFYEAVTGRPMRREMAPCGTMEMALFLPPDGTDCPQGCVAKGEHFRPSQDGALVYLDGGDDLAAPLSRAEAAGGTVLMPKTSIAPHGFIAMFLDTEGNRVGLYSMT